MSDVNPPRKAYTSPVREERLGATRRRILEVARRLFGERGYSATTMEAIAAESGLAVPTIYKNFGNKRNLLLQLIYSSLYTPDYVAGAAPRNSRARLVALAEMIVNFSSRAADVASIVSGAIGADPEFERMLRQLHGGRRENAAQIAHLLAADDALPSDRTEEQARDILYALVGPELYDLFVKHSGWSDEQFEAWLSDTLVRLLLKPEAAGV